MFTTESLLTSRHGFCLPATRLQRAIYRISDGVPLEDLASDPVVADVLGGGEALAKLPTAQPREFYCIAGVRTAKSLFAAAKALRATRTVDFGKLRPGETPVITIVSTSTKMAKIVYNHLRGTVESQPSLRELLATPFRQDGVSFWHPNGRKVDIEIVAGARAGASLVGRWNAGSYFDEFPRMSGEGESVVNFDDCRKAVLARLLPGAQLIGIGSPHAETGPAFRVVNESWGHPSPQRVVVYGAPGPAMNPEYFDAEKLADLQTDPLVYRTDVEGKFAAEFSGLFATGQLERCLRKTKLQMEPTPGWHYVATIDPSERTDAWTLVVLTRDPEQKIHVALAHQWKPRAGQPLDPRVVFRAIADKLAPYGVKVVISDQFAASAHRALALDAGLFLSDRNVTLASKVDSYDALRILVSCDAISIPDVEDLADDLRRVRRRVTASSIVIDLPRIAGRHCDYASALALGLTQTLAPPETPVRARANMDADWQQTEREWLTTE